MSDTNVDTNVRISVQNPDGQRVWQQYADDAKRATASVRDALSSLNEATGKAKRATEDLGRATKDHVGRETTQAFGAAQHAVTEYIGAFAKWGAIEEAIRRSYHAFSDVQRSMSLLGFSTGATQQQIAAFTRQMQDLSVDTGRSVNELTSNFKAFKSASGLSFEEAQKSFPLITRAAEVTGSAIEDMGRAAGAAINNLKVPQAELSATLDAWVKQVPGSMMDAFSNVAPRLTAQMNSIGFTGKQAAIDLAALFTEASKTLGNTRLAASGLNEMFNGMANNSTVLGARMLPVLDEIQKRGGSVKDAVQAMINIMEEYGAFSTDIFRKAQARQLFGDDQIRLVTAYRDHQDRVTKSVKEGYDAVGTAEKRAAQLHLEEKAAADALTASISNLGIAFGALISVLGVSTVFRSLAAELTQIMGTVTKITSELDALGKWMAKPNLSQAGKVIGDTAKGFHFPSFGSVVRGMMNTGKPAAHEAAPGSPAAEGESGGRTPIGRGGDSGFEVPQFARGGIVNKSTIIEAGEAGPEAILPLGDSLRDLVGGGGKGKENTEAINENTKALERLAALITGDRDTRDKRLGYTPGFGEGSDGDVGGNRRALGIRSGMDRGVRGYGGGIGGGGDSGLGEGLGGTAPSGGGGGVGGGGGAPSGGGIPSDAQMDAKDRAWFGGGRTGGGAAPGGGGGGGSVGGQVPQSMMGQGRTGANFMGSRAAAAAGMNVSPGEVETVMTKAGPVSVNKHAKGDMVGFVNALVDAGAPVGHIGSYSNRNIAGTGRKSQHAYGNAMDLFNQTGRGVISREGMQWLRNNPDVYRKLKQQYNIVGGEEFGDVGHIEYGGPGYGEKHYGKTDDGAVSAPAAGAGAEQPTAGGQPQAAGEPAGAGFTGTASWYQPGVGYKGGGPQTASGAPYRTTDFAAAVPQSMRGAYGGVKYGTEGGHALVQSPDGKSAVVNINDVMGKEMEGSGRVIDLNRGSANYFGTSGEAGLTKGMKVTPLKGYKGATGPVSAEQATSMLGGGAKGDGGDKWSRGTSAVSGLATKEDTGSSFSDRFKGADSGEGALEQHMAMREQMEKPIKLQVEAPRALPTGASSRAAYARAEARRFHSDALGSERYSPATPADMGSH